jgi:hypothetical protein
MHDVAESHPAVLAIVCTNALRRRLEQWYIDDINESEGKRSPNLLLCDFNPASVKDGAFSEEEWGRRACLPMSVVGPAHARLAALVLSPSAATGGNGHGTYAFALVE